MVGVDNLNDYYDVRLKNYRVNTLLGQAETPLASPNLVDTSTGLAKAESADGRFHFYHLDIENQQSVDALFEAHEFASVLNLAARTGVLAKHGKSIRLHDHEYSRHSEPAGNDASPRRSTKWFSIHFLPLCRAGDAVCGDAAGQHSNIPIRCYKKGRRVDGSFISLSLWSGYFGGSLFYGFRALRTPGYVDVSFYRMDTQRKTN